MVCKVIVVYIPDPVAYADRIKNLLLSVQGYQILVFCREKDFRSVESLCFQFCDGARVQVVPRSDVLGIYIRVLRLLFESKNSVILFDLFGKLVACSVLSFLFRRRFKRITFLFSYPFRCFFECARKYGIKYCLTRGFLNSIFYGCFQFVNSVLADLVVLQTEELKNYVWFERFIRSKIRVVHNCLSVTSDDLQKIYLDRFSVKVQETNTIKLLFAGNFSLGKGAREFLSLVELILQKDIAVEAFIVGKVTDNTRKIENDRFNRLQKVGILRVLGPLEHPELLQLMQVSHYLVHFSICDGSARTVLEAMGMGVVPVVLDHPGLTFLKKSGCGLVYNSTTSSELAKVAGDVISAKIENPTLWQEMAIHNLRFVDKRRSLGATSSQWVNLVCGT